MERAIEFEARRQIELLEDGKSVVQETRLYDPERDETRSMRTKEDAQDYRYFPDPDLLPLVVTDKMIEEVREATPELPDVRRKRFMEEYKLSAYDAALMTASRRVSEYFEETVRLTREKAKVLIAIEGKEPVLSGVAKLCCNWIGGQLAAALNNAGLDIQRSPISPSVLSGLLARLIDNTVNNKSAKQVFDVLWDLTAADADQAIDKLGLKQDSDSAEIERLVDQVLAANGKQVQDYRAGKEKAFNSLVGQVMKATRGKANPAQVNELLKKKLS
jgi:aspartyl-tRNA(Asn)/glutamyl-tRNA(Gln) amidotransferase subunit B